MYLLNFVNSVRRARGYEDIDQLPGPPEPATQLELAMDCTLEDGLIRLPTPNDATAVSAATGMPIGFDGVTVAMPAGLAAMGEALSAEAVGAVGARYGYAGV